MSTENRSQAKRAVLISCSDHYGHRLWAVDTYLKSRGYETVYLTSDFSHDRKAAFTCSVPGCRQLHVRPYQKNLSADRILSHREFAKKAVRWLEELEQELKVLLLPKDPNDDKNVIVEFRAGAGGDEAALFTAEICRMYIKYAESRGWKTELTSADENGIGGFKDATLLINGAGAYSRMKYESGTHRVQRVPETESGGRIHTSTMTVAIMPEVDDVEVQIDPKDYKFDVFRASGNGGQCVNTTDSAVRLTHFPSGIVISCQDEKSQLKNKDKALKILRARLYDLEQQKQHDEMAELRKSQVGTGDRSEKIRTYNFPQGRVTDHRIKLTLYKLDAIMNGDLDEIIDSLIAADQAAKLSSMQEEA